MNIYADTSFFVSLYLPDRYSAEAERRLASKSRVWLTPLNLAEWTHAISQHVFRKEISLRDAGQAQTELERGLWKRTVAGSGLARISMADLHLANPESMDLSLAFAPSTACMSPQPLIWAPTLSGPLMKGKPNSLWQKAYGYLDVVDDGSLKPSTDC